MLDPEDDDAGAPSEHDADAPQMTAEDQARLRGWKPLEEYKGPPGRWRSAEEYLRIGDSDNAVLREENRRLTARLHRVEGQLTGVNSTLEELRDIARRADKQGYDRALKELKDRRAEAVANADTSAFDQIESQIEALRGERAAPSPPPPPPVAAQIDPVIQNFIDTNPWYRKDQVLRDTMMRLYDIVHAKNPTWEIEDLLTEAKRRTIEEFPEKFGVPAGGEEPPAPRPRPRASSVLQPAGGAPRPPRGASGFDTIADPEERRQVKLAYESAARADPGLTVDEYLTVLNDPHADVLALRRARKP